MARKQKKRKAKRSSPKKTLPKMKSCALVPLNTKKIRKELLKKYKRRKKVLDNIEIQLDQFNECDKPEFQKFLAQNFGAEQTNIKRLNEALGLANIRRERIRFLARESGMTQGRYCASIESMVTPDTDFWKLIENNIEEVLKRQRRLEEEFRSYYQEYDDEEDYEDWEDDDCLEEDCFDSVFGDMEDLFADLLGDVFPDMKIQYQGNNEKNDLKKIYRDLCFRYHPDKVDVQNVKNRKLWFSIQEAYEAEDLVRLRNIHAGIEMEKGKTELPCADIIAMSNEIEYSIKMTRKELHYIKRHEHWGFTTWAKEKFEKTKKDMAKSYRNQIEKAEQKLKRKEAEIKRIRFSFIKKDESAKRNKSLDVCEEKKPEVEQLEFLF